MRSLVLNVQLDVGARALVASVGLDDLVVEPLAVRDVTVTACHGIPHVTHASPAVMKVGGKPSKAACISEPAIGPPGLQYGEVRVEAGRSLKKSSTPSGPSSRCATSRRLTGRRAGAKERTGRKSER